MKFTEGLGRGRKNNWVDHLVYHINKKRNHI